MGTRNLALGLATVVVSLLVLFTAPASYFVALTFVATIVMVAASYALGGLRGPPRISGASVAVGLASAAVLYGIFYLGGATVDILHPLGINSSSEASIYRLIASPSNPLYLQVLLLLFDSAGYESFFRGTLQKKLQGRFGIAAAPLVALFDAALHIATLNPVWIGATFVTDLTWGITYYYGRGLQASFTSHFVWDLAIFIIRPVI